MTSLLRVPLCVFALIAIAPATSPAQTSNARLASLQALLWRAVLEHNPDNIVKLATRVCVLSQLEDELDVAKVEAKPTVSYIPREDSVLVRQLLSDFPAATPWDCLENPLLPRLDVYGGVVLKAQAGSDSLIAGRFDLRLIGGPEPRGATVTYEHVLDAVARKSSGWRVEIKDVVMW